MIKLYRHYLIYNWPFGNLGIGNSASASALASASASALRKFYFQLTKFFFFFFEKIEHLCPIRLNILRCALLLCKFAVFKVRIMAISIHIVHMEIAMVRKHYLLLKSHVKKDFTQRENNLPGYLSKLDFIISQCSNISFISCFKIAYLIAFI